MNPELLLADETLMHAHVQPLELPSEYLKSEPFDYQLQGMAWMQIRETCPLRSCYGGMVLDEPGLGKTFMMYGHLLNRVLPKEATLIVVPAHLLHVWETEFEKHFTDGGQSKLPLYTYYGPKRHDVDVAKAIGKGKTILTSYGVLASIWQSARKDDGAYRAFFETTWGRIVLDEAHYIRNCKTRQSQAVRGLQGRRKWAITATPIYNIIHDLYAIMSFLGVRPFVNSRTGKRLWNNFIRRQAFHNMVPLRNLLIDLSIRRNKALLRLPDPTFTIQQIPMNSWQREFYSALYDYCRHRTDLLLGRVEGLERIKLNLCSDHVVSGAEAAAHASHYLSCALTQILRLKQASCCPLLVFKNLKRLHKIFSADKLAHPDAETIARVIDRLRELKTSPQNECPICFDDEATHVAIPCRHACCAHCWRVIRNSSNRCPMCRSTVISTHELKVEMEHLENRRSRKRHRQSESIGDRHYSGKVEYLVRYVEEIIMQTDEKIVVISQWAGFLDIILEALRSAFPSAPENRFLMLTGKKQIGQRNQIIDQFQSDPEVRVLLLTLGAGGEGITLTAGSRLIMTDRWWNAAKEYQAENRIHRIGQTQEVQIVLLESENSIEQVITRIVNHKQLISSALVEDTKRILNAKTWLRRISCCLSLEDMETVENK
jgi:SNF2 family DNA or RNA helicase